MAWWGWLIVIATWVWAMDLHRRVSAAGDAIERIERMIRADFARRGQPYPIDE